MLTNEVIGSLFVTGILGCLVVFLLFKFGLHYKIMGLNRFANAFYYSVFEYKKAQVSPSELSYMDSVREQAEVSLAANFDPTLKTADLKIPTTLYSGKDPFLAKLRAKIQKAEKIKLDARHLDRKADVLLGKTKEELVEKDLTDKTPQAVLDRIFEIENGVAAIIDLTVDEIRSQGYGRAPDYEIITQIALDENPYFARTFRYFDSEDIVGVLFRAPFMIILIGIIGTFAGFYLALNEGGDIKSGASVAIVSSLVGLPVSLFMEYLNTLFPDEGRYRQAFNKFRVTLEMLFNHEQELNKTQNEGEMALAMAKAEQERVDALAEQETELEKQKLLELTRAAQELREHAEGALAAAEQEQVDALAKQGAELEEAKELALANAEKERVDALAMTSAEQDVLSDTGGLREGQGDRSLTSPWPPRTSSARRPQPYPTETSPTDPPCRTQGRVRSASRAHPRIPSSSPCMVERRECILAPASGSISAIMAASVFHGIAALGQAVVCERPSVVVQRRPEPMRDDS